MRGKPPLPRRNVRPTRSAPTSWSGRPPCPTQRSSDRVGSHAIEHDGAPPRAGFRADFRPRADMPTAAALAPEPDGCRVALVTLATMWCGAALLRTHPLSRRARPEQPAPLRAPLSGRSRKDHTWLRKRPSRLPRTAAHRGDAQLASRRQAADWPQARSRFAPRPPSATSARLPARRASESPPARGLRARAMPLQWALTVGHRSDAQCRAPAVVAVGAPRTQFTRGEAKNGHRNGRGSTTTRAWFRHPGRGR
jgi:hypothetical protein